MKRSRLSAAVLATACLTLAVSVRAELRIAVLDLEHLFDHYWKTAEANLRFKEKQEEFKQEFLALEAEFNQTRDSQRQRAAEAKDPALSDAEKERRRQAAVEAAGELRAIQQRLEQLDRTARGSLEGFYLHTKTNLVREIVELVRAQGKAAGYNLILDSSAQGARNTLMVLYAHGVPDLTRETLQQLNQNAPPGLPTPAPARTATNAPTVWSR